MHDFEIVLMTPYRVSARRYFDGKLCPDCYGDGETDTSGEMVECSRCSGEGSLDERWELIGDPDPGLLTSDELLAMDISARLSNVLLGLIGNGPTSDYDAGEAVANIHAIQHTIMSQAAARSYPKLFRQLGGVIQKDDI
jgi:DnaJ-class molecular chaperone